MNQNNDPAKEARGAQRRNLLKLVFVGGASFLLGKVLGPGLSLFSSSRPVDLTNPAELKNFRLVETERQLKLYNKTGEEIMVIDKSDIASPM